MNSKLSVLLLVVVVAVAAVGAYFFFTGPNSDYTLLDSNDNIKPGMTIIEDMKSSQLNMHSEYVVEEVTDGTVKYKETMNMDGPVKSTLYDYAPDQYDFDYTDSTDFPSGVTVTTEGNKYFISGTAKESYGGSSSESTYNMTIEWNGTDVISVNGTEKTVYKSEMSESTSETSVKTVDGVVSGTGKMSGWAKASDTVESFYGHAVDKYDASDFTGCTIVDSTGKVGNVDTTVHTINGTHDSFTYSDFKIYEYKGYTIKGEGTVNGAKATMTVDIYMA